MTQQELGITDTGLQYIVAIIHRGKVEEKREALRQVLPIGAPNIYDRELTEAEAAVNYWQNRSHDEWCSVMKERGWYQEEVA